MLDCETQEMCVSLWRGLPWNREDEKGEELNMKLKELDFVEKKGCLTFSKACVNIGKTVDLETGREKYYCARCFPEDCTRYGCPKLNTMKDPERMQLITLCPRALKSLRERMAVTVKHDQK